MKLLIAEDDILISENLASIIKNQGYKVEAIVDSMSAFEEQLNLSNFEAALLDIRMHGADLGIEMARMLSDKNIPFVFITSFSDKDTLQSAVACRPFAYVVKPFKKEEIIKTLTMLKNATNKEFIVARSGNKTVRLDPYQIRYIKSDNIYLNIFLEQDELIIRDKLQDFIEKLPDDHFVRPHQSYAVNKNYVKAYDGSLSLTTGEVIPVSRKYKMTISGLFE